ncbi:MAG: hypothetical protein ACKV0T_14165 [Planctomycetales bacterium]
MSELPQTESDAPVAATSTGLKRHRPAGALLLALVLFPLPWIRVSCGEHSPGQQRKVYFSATQSGLQATYGGITYHPGTMNEQQAQSQGAGRKEAGGAPLLVIYALLLLAGIVASIKVRSEVVRLKSMLACSAGALALLVTQVAIGFPLKPKNGTSSGTPDPLYHLFLEMHYTLWFWLALAATIAALGLVGIDWWRRPRQEAR